MAEVKSVKFNDARSSPSSSSGVVMYHRSSALRLAIITTILFSCALVFLVASLIIPIMHSVNTERHVVSNSTSEPPAAAAAADNHRHQRPARSAPRVVHALRQLAAVCLEFHSSAFEAFDVLFLRFRIFQLLTHKSAFKCLIGLPVTYALSSTY